MSQAAGKRRRAKTEQSAVPGSLDQLAELHAAFKAAAAPARSAEQPFRQALTAPVAANDPIARAPLPRLKRRSLRLDPALAVALMKGLDWAVVLLAADLAAHWGADVDLAAMPIGQAAGFLAAALMLKTGLWLTGAYRTPARQLTPEHGVGGLALGAIAGLLVAAFAAPDARAAAALSALLPLAALLLAGVHAAFAVWIAAAHRKGAFSETIVLVGATDAAARFVECAAKTGEARIVAVIDDRLTRAPAAICGAPVVGALDDLLAWPSLPEIDRLIITVTPKAEARVRAMIARLAATPNRVDLLLDYEAQAVSGARVERIGANPIACVSGRPHNAAFAALKRAEDVLLGSVLCLVFAPVMLALAIAIRLDSKGPALYRQQRHGFNNRVITVLKFRTMRHDPDAPLQQVQRNDPRITRIGGFLRRMSLDELPQLFNVLRGEMSLVGPRPHAIGMKAGADALDDIVAEYAHRHRVKPGITGWAQVNGSRGPIETPDAVRARVALDLDYVSRASLLLDLWILLRTAPALLGDAKTR